MGGGAVFDFYQVTYVDSTHVDCWFRDHASPFANTTISSIGAVGASWYQCSGGITVTAAAVGGTVGTIRLTVDTLAPSTLYTFSIAIDHDTGTNGPHAAGTTYNGDGTHDPGVQSLTTPGGNFQIDSATGINSTHVDVYFSANINTVGELDGYIIDDLTGINSLVSVATVDGVDPSIVHLTLNTSLAPGTHSLRFDVDAPSPPTSSGLTFLAGDTIYFSIPQPLPPGPIPSPAFASYRGNYYRTGRLRPFNDAQRMVRKRVSR